MLTTLQNVRKVGHERRLIEQMTYSRLEVRKKEIFPARQTTTSISFLSGSGADPTGRTDWLSHATRQRPRKHSVRRGFPAFKSSGLLTSIRSSRAKNRISVTACCPDRPPRFDAVPQSGHPGRRFGPRPGGCCRPQNRRTRRHSVGNRDIRAMVVHCRVAPTPAASPDPHG